MASLPDRVVGGLKGEANAVLNMLPFTQSVSRFQPSNAEQAETMRGVKDVEPELQTGLAMSIPGPRSTKGEIGEILRRGGIDKESAARLGRKAAEAEEKL